MSKKRFRAKPVLGTCLDGVRDMAHIGIAGALSVFGTKISLRTGNGTSCGRGWEAWFTPLKARRIAQALLDAADAVEKKK